MLNERRPAVSAVQRVPHVRALMRDRTHCPARGPALAADEQDDLSCNLAETVSYLLLSSVSRRVGVPMHALLQQLPALVGVVIGALASYLAGAATERARWRRQHAARWDASRMEAYASYALTVKTFILIANRISASRNLGSSPSLSRWTKGWRS